MTDPVTPKPTFWQNTAKSVETWGLAHWTYIAVAVVANVLGAIFRV